MSVISEIMRQADHFADESVRYHTHQNVKQMVMRDVARNDLVCAIRTALDMQDEEIALLRVRLHRAGVAPT